MKVTHIYKTFFPDTFGGIEQAIFNIVDVVAADFSLITLSKHPRANNNTYNNKLKLIRYPINLNIASCPMSYQLLKDYKKIIDDADILHYHFPWPFADLLHIFHRINKPTIVSFQSEIIKQKKLNSLYQPLMRKFFSKVDKIIVASENYLNSSPILKPYKDKCQIIPIGIAKENYPQPDSEKLAQWQQKLGTNFGLFIGVLRYYKGLHFLLDAAIQTQVPIVIAGDGPEMQKLKQKAATLKLKNVYFMGKITDLDKNALLSLCRYVVLPSHLRSEAYGVSLVEGLLFGKPLISCEIGTGTSYININGHTGFVVAPEDPSALAAAMNKLYQDDNLAENMGRAAKERYENYFTAAKTGAAYAEIYNNLTLSK